MVAMANDYDNVRRTLYRRVTFGRWPCPRARFRASSNPAALAGEENKWLSPPSFRIHPRQKYDIAPIPAPNPNRQAVCHRPVAIAFKASAELRKGGLPIQASSLHY
jgi:hypothetical protein